MGLVAGLAERVNQYLRKAMPVQGEGPRGNDTAALLLFARTLHGCCDENN